MYLFSTFLEKNKFVLKVLLLKCTECRLLGGFHNLKSVAEAYLTSCEKYL